MNTKDRLQRCIRRRMDGQW